MVNEIILGLTIMNTILLIFLWVKINNESYDLKLKIEILEGMLRALDRDTVFYAKSLADLLKEMHENESYIKELHKNMIKKRRSKHE